MTSSSESAELCLDAGECVHEAGEVVARRAVWRRSAETGLRRHVRRLGEGRLTSTTRTLLIPYGGEAR